MSDSKPALQAAVKALVSLSGVWRNFLCVLWLVELSLHSFHLFAALSFWVIREGEDDVHINSHWDWVVKIQRLLGSGETLAPPFLDDCQCGRRKENDADEEVNLRRLLTDSCILLFVSLWLSSFQYSLEYFQTGYELRDVVDTDMLGELELLPEFVINYQWLFFDFQVWFTLLGVSWLFVTAACDIRVLFTVRVGGVPVLSTVDSALDALCCTFTSLKKYFW